MLFNPPDQPGVEKYPLNGGDGLKRPGRAGGRTEGGKGGMRGRTGGRSKGWEDGGMDGGRNEGKDGGMEGRMEGRIAPAMPTQPGPTLHPGAAAHSQHLL